MNKICITAINLKPWSECYCSYVHLSAQSAYMVSFHETSQANQPCNNFRRLSTGIQSLQNQVLFQNYYKIYTPEIVSLQWTPSWKIHT